MNGTQAKVCLFIAIFKFKVALLDRVTRTVQIRLRSDRDYNTTIGSVRGYVNSSDASLTQYIFLQIGVYSMQKYPLQA